MQYIPNAMKSTSGLQNQVIANQLKRQNDELVKLRETLEAKNISELRLQVRTQFLRSPLGRNLVP
jgi:hypothetical protein